MPEAQATTCVTLDYLERESAYYEHYYFSKQYKDFGSVTFQWADLPAYNASSDLITYTSRTRPRVRAIVPRLSALKSGKVVELESGVRLITI